MTVDGEDNGEEDPETAAARAAQDAIEAALDVALDAQRERDAELQSELAGQWDYDEPSADLAIQAEYHSALGEFIVGFNRLDNLLTEVLKLALSEVGKLELFAVHRQRGFAAKMGAIELLQTNKTMGNLEAVPLEEMKKIASIRNFLAHAHFDQNPYDGTYQLVPPKTDKPSSEWQLKPTAIREWAARADKTCDRVKNCEAAFVFGPIELD